MAEENQNIENQNIPQESEDLGTTSQNPMLDDPYSISTFTRPGTTNIENFMPIKGGYPGVNLQSDITSDYFQVRDNITGFPPYSPDQIPKDPHQRAKMWASKIGQDARQHVDRNQYSKPYMYDNTAPGSHRARYLAYGQETFDKIGFNPLLNNEDVFNSQTSIMDDFKRMATHSFGPMFGLGFLAGPKSYAQFAGGQYGQDIELADDYEAYNSIGMSTKGGVGGFVNNLFNSVAYSAGVLVEAVLENALIGAVEGAIVGSAGGPAGTLAGTMGGATGGGIFGLLKSGPQMVKGLYGMMKYGGKMTAQLKNLKKYNAAKELWKTASTNTANYINPLGQTSRAIQRNVLTNADDLANLARTTRVFGAFFRDANMINAAFSEGRLEGGFVENNTYRRGYDEFWKREGRAPTPEEDLNLRKISKTAGFRATLKNALLINYTNKLAFPNLFKANLLRRASGNVGRINRDFAMHYARPKGGGLGGKWKATEYTFKNALKGLIKPRTLGKASVNYFKLNVVEGAQEVLQDVIAQSSEEYYIESFFDPAKQNFDYSMATLRSAFGEQFGEQGFETFMSGFFMGTLLRPINKAPQFIDSQFTRWTQGKEAADAHSARRKNHATKVEGAMNRLSNPLDLLNNRSINYAQQSIISKSNNRTDIDTKQSKDNVTSSAVSDIVTVLQNNMYGVWLDHMQGYDKLSPNELEHALGLEKGEGPKAKDQLQTFLKRAERIKSRYEFSLGNVTSRKIDLTKLKEGTPEYDKAAIYNSAIDRAHWNLVFFQESFDDSLERLTKMYSKLNNMGVFNGLPSGDFQNITDLKRLSSEIELLNSEIKILQESEGAITSSDIQNQLQHKIKVRDALVSFQASQQEWTVEAKELLIKALAKFETEDATVDIEKALEEVIGDYEDDYDPNLNYKTSFENLLKVLVDDDVKFQKMLGDVGNEVLDNLFTDLVDIHKLQHESLNLVPAINLLLDEQGFTEHVNRNFDWMRNLWLTRKEYYKKAINDSIEKKEYNDLLWSLSQENIYIDLDEFGKWIEDKENYIPKEFIDVSQGNERVIPQGSMLFDKYYEQFRVVARMQRVKPAGEESGLVQQRDQAVADLISQKESELESARKSYEEDVQKETGQTVEDIELSQEQEDVDPKSIKIQQARIQVLEKEKDELLAILKRLTEGDNAIFELDEKLQQLFKTQVLGYTYDEYQTNFRPLFTKKVQEDPELNELLYLLSEKIDLNDKRYVGNVITDGYAVLDLINEEQEEIKEYLDQSKEQEAVPKITLEDTQSYKDYQRALAEIENKYTTLIDEVNQNFRDRGMTTDDLDTAVKLTDTWDSLPKDLKDELQLLFDERLDDPELINVDPVEYERKRQAWFSEQVVLVNKYNDRRSTERLQAEKDAVTIKAPKLKFKAVPNVIDKTISEIKDIINTYKSYINAGAKPKGRLGSEKLTKADEKNLNNDIKQLETLIDKKRRNLAEISDYVEVIELFKNRVLDRQVEVEEVKDEEGNLVRFIDGKPARRVTEIAAEIDYKVNKKEKWRYNKLDQILPLVDLAKDPDVKDQVKQFMTSLRSLRLPQFANPAKYAVVEETLREGEIKEKGVITEQPNFTKEIVERIVSEQAYAERSEGGQAVDTTSKDFFTREGAGFKKPVRPDNMSEEAFEQLYGRNGIITKFRDRMIDGEFQIIGTSDILFDKELGIAGESDLIAVNSEGQFMIIDIKALTENSWKNYNVGRQRARLKQTLRDQGLSEEEINEHEDVKKLTDKYSQRNYFRYQQSMYRNLFYRMTGKVPLMAILPIELKYDYKTSTIVSAKRADTVLAKNADLLNLDYAAEVSEYIPEKEPVFETQEGKEIIVEPLKDDEFYLIEEYAKSNKLKDNLNKVVIYEGRVGALVQTPEGTYGVKFVDAQTKQSTILDILDPEKLSATTDGELTLQTASLGKILEIKNLGQVTTVDGVEINAFFINESQTTANINGVIYEVNRDKMGKIVSLGYNTNDAKIRDLEIEMYVEIENSIAALEQWRKFEAKTTAEKNTATNQIADERIRMRQLQAKVDQLKKTNSRRTARGGNANAMIFALNRLPVNFVTNRQKQTQGEELDNIKRLATISDAMFDAVAVIMMNQYPEKLDQLIEKGPSGLTQKDYLSIQLWAEEVNVQLLQLESELKNKGELETYVQGVRNQITELQNNLELIKLTKDGKISRQQAKAREVFGPKAEVPFGFDISDVQRVDRGPAERVPGSKRQPTLEEQKRVISNQLGIDEVKLSETPKKSAAQDILLEKINNLTKDNFEKGSANILIQATANPNIKVADITEALNKKREDLQTAIEDVVEGQHIISKEGSVTMKITKVFKNGNVSLEDINNNKNKLKLTMEELQEQFNVVTEESPAFKEEVIEVTPEDQGGLEESKSSLEELSEEDIQNRIAEKTDKKNRRDRLRNRPCKN